MIESGAMITARVNAVCTIAALLCLYAFGVYLRMEDYPAWNSMPEVFQYEDEYKMANFDSYYYLIAARAIQQGTYDTLDEQRQVPFGKSRPKIPPLSSWVAVVLSQWLNISINTVAIFFPVFLAPLLVFVIYLMGRDWGLQRRNAILAAFFGVLSYTYVVRSRIGVFDTDCMNVVWLCWHTWLATRCFQQKNGQDKCSLIPLLGLMVSTMLFTLWWNTAAFVAVLSGLIPISVQWALRRPGDLRLLGILLLGWVWVIIVFYQPIFSFIVILLGWQKTAFPLLGGVTELEPVGWIRFAQETSGHGLLLAISLAGLVIRLKHSLRSSLGYCLPLGLCFAPLFLGNRFMIFSAPILGVGAAYGFQELMKHSLLTWQLKVVFLCAIISIQLESNLSKVVKKLTKPAIDVHAGLIEQLKRIPSEQATIWTSWSLGYQIQYYLNHSTIADGEFNEGGETLFYLSLPFATDNLAFSANFMKFYASRNIRILYDVFDSEQTTLVFLKEILKYPPSTAKRHLERKLKLHQLSPLPRGVLSQVDIGAQSPVSQWLEFLYPKHQQPLYFFLHQRMLKSLFWFKQGNLDLGSQTTIGLPFYMSFYPLARTSLNQAAFKTPSNLIQNNEIQVNTQLGLAKHSSGALHSFAYILQCGEDECAQQAYAIPPAMQSQYQNQDRFVFEWHERDGFGAALSPEVANTTFNKLFLRQGAGQTVTPYFSLISQDIPYYQLWQVNGDVYRAY